MSMIHDLVPIQQRQHVMEFGEYCPPITYKRILVFDTETTGLLRKRPTDPALIPEYLALSPYITQLCFVVYDIPTQQIVKVYNQYIRLDKGVEITPKASEITGITLETGRIHGIDMGIALTEFLGVLRGIDCVVSHNIEFDKTMIMLEMERRGRGTIRLFRSMDTYCTMKNTTQFCELAPYYAKRGWKYPRLAELYFKLFEVEPLGMHNAQMDVLACLRCFLKFRMGMEMTQKNIWDLTVEYKKKE